MGNQANGHSRRRRRWAAFAAAGVALAAHAAGFAVLATMRADFPSPRCADRLLLLIDATAETGPPRYEVAALPRAIAPPVVTPAPVTVPMVLEATPRPTPAETPQPDPPPDDGDANTDDRLEAEREELRRMLSQTRAESMIDAERAVLQAMAARDRSLQVTAGPKGTIRELDLSGWPAPVVDEIMARYDMRVSRKPLSSPSRQTFLSSAADHGGEKFYANQYRKPGIYEVFELSPQAVAVMSRLEEREIRGRQLDLERTRVNRVVFGIKELSPGRYDLSVLRFEAERLD